MVGSVTNFSRNGLSDWLLQRLSAMVVLSYIAFNLWYIFFHGPSYTEWVGLQHNLWMRAFNILFLLSLLAHAWIGIWTVLTDYVNPAPLRLTLQVLLFLTLFGLLMWGLWLILY